jgi:Holliday junction resolvase
MSSEKAIVQEVVDELKRRGFWVLKVHGGPMQKAGIPDVLAVFDGQLWAFEVKAQGGVVSRLQRKRMDELEQAGAYAFVVRSVGELIYALDTHQW